MSEINTNIDNNRNREIALAAMRWDAEREAEREAKKAQEAGQEQAQALKAQEKPLLTHSGTAPRPAGEFAALIEKLEAEKVQFLLDGCPEVELPSIVDEVNLEETEALDMIKGLPADVRYVVEVMGRVHTIDGVFAMSGFLQAGATCTGMRAGIVTSADEIHRERGTLDILSIGHSSDGKGRGVTGYFQIIDKIVKEQNAAHKRARKLRLEAVGGELSPARKATKGDKSEEPEKKKGRKIIRIPHFRAYTTSPTEGAIVDIHIDNPHAGVTLRVDEAGNALKEMTKFTKGGGEESARNLLINGFDAKQPYIRDRMNHDDEEGYAAVDRFGMSFVGGLQTQYAAQFFSGNDGKSRGRGMAQRFLSFCGAELPAFTGEITLQSLYANKDKTDAIEVNEYLYRKYAAMLDLDRVLEFYDLVHDKIQEDKDLYDLNEMIEFGLNKDTIFFKMQPHALLELERFKQRMHIFKQQCKYTQDEKSSIAYDRMKIDKIIAVLHYFKWADLPVRKRHPFYYLIQGAYQYTQVPRAYERIDVKYGDIQNIPVTVDTVQAAILIVLFSANCRRNLFDEGEDTTMQDKIMEFYEWAEGDGLWKLCDLDDPKTFMLKEIVAMKIKVFKSNGKQWGQGKIRDFLQKSLKLEKRKMPRGYVYDFLDLPELRDKCERESGAPKGRATPPPDGCAVIAVTKKPKCSVSA